MRTFDRLISGMLDKEMSFKLKLEQDNLTLEKAVELARHCEMVNRKNEADREIHAISSLGNPTCKRRGHNTDKCRATCKCHRHNTDKCRATCKCHRHCTDKCHATYRGHKTDRQHIIRAADADMSIVHNAKTHARQ